MREKWRKILAEDRYDEFYKPNYRSDIVCSYHFLESDMYLTPKGFRRLKKTAVPQITITEDGDSTEPTNPKIKRENGEHEEPIASSSTDILELAVKRSAINVKSQQDLDSESELSSVSSSELNSPRTTQYKKELKECHRRLEIKNKQLRNLRTQIRRLQKTNATMKDTINGLKGTHLMPKPLRRFKRQQRKCNANLLDE